MRNAVLISVLTYILLIFFIVIHIIPFYLVNAEPSGWEDDFRLTNNPNNSYFPDITADMNNDIHMVWKDERQDQGTGGIYYKNCIDLSWSDDLLLNPDEAWGLRPAITYDNDNAIHIIWFASGTIPDSLDIFHRTYNGISWEDIEPITTTGASYLTTEDSIGGPKIVIDTNNYIYVFWSADRNPINSVMTNNKNVAYIFYNGVDWSNIIDITNDSDDHIDPSVHLDSTDNINLVYTYRWPDGIGGYYFAVYYQQYDGNDWSTPSKIDNSNNAVAPDILVDSNDNIHITWADGRSGNYEIYYSKLNSDGNIIIDNKRITYNPEDPGWHGVWRKSSSLDSKDNIHITWHNQEGDDFEEFTVMYIKLDSNGDVLQNKTNLTIAALGNENSPMNVIDSNNRIHIVFMDDRDGNHEIYYKAGKYYDLSISSSDIQFSNSLPSNGEYIKINASIHNTGGYLMNASIHFYQDSIEPGNHIDSDFVSVPADGTELASITWDSVTGTHSIWVEIEPEDGITESNLTNNLANKTIIVNDPPSISVTSPPSGIITVDDSYTIAWVGHDPDDDATIELYYDNDNMEHDGTLIDTSDQYSSGIVDNNGASQSYNWDTSALSDESDWYIYAKIDDNMHAPVYSYSQGRVKIDHQNVPPIVEITPPAGGTISGIVTIQGTASDEDNDIQIVEIKIDNEGWIETIGTTSWSHEWDTRTYTNGEHTITARANDDTGLYSIEDSIIVNVDNGGNIAPSIKIKSHSNGEVIGGSVQIKGTASDTDGVVESVEIRIDDESWSTVTGTNSWSYTWDTTTYTNGEHEVHVRAKDDIDEYSLVKSITLIIDNGGNIPPIVTITIPSGGVVSGTVNIKGTASDLDGDNTLSFVQIKIDEDWEYINGITDWSHNWDTTSLDDGNYTISVRAYDGTDYSMTKSVDVYVDNPHKPILTITSDIPKKVSGSITIRGVASDIDGEITKVEIRIDEGEWKEIEGEAIWSYELDTTKLSDGKHTITIRVHDDEGEYEEEVFDISVDNSSDNLILILVIIIIIILVIVVISGFIIKNKKAGKQTSSPQPISQTSSQTIRCPQCNNSFVISGSSTIVQCPHCGLSGNLK